MEVLIEISQGFIYSHGYIAIFILTTLEQFIFPVPADFFIAAGTSNGLVVGKVLTIVLFAATIGSLIGYILGKYLGHPAALWLFGKRKLDIGEKFIKKWGMWGIIIAGVTPIPFKLITWMAGVFEMPPRKFLLGVVIGRMPRYILTAYAASYLIDTQLLTTENTAAFILGAIQGVTEFLPISSSGHLVVVEHFLKVPISPSELLTFDIFLHGGSLTAILLYFWRDWIKVLKEAADMLKEFKVKTDTLAFKLAAATLPTIVAALLFKDQISERLRNLNSVAIFFILIGMIYFYTAWKGKKSHIQGVNLKKAIIIGLAQALALIPGISRAGSTIATGVSLGISRETAARFSFMLGGVAILAANAYSLITLGNSPLPDLAFVLTGTLSSFLFSIISIYFLLRFLQKYTMRAFGVYLILAGTAILSFL